MTFTLFRAATVALTLVLLTAASALAGPPLITDDAGTVEVGKVEIELNGSYADDKVTKAGITCKTSTTDAEMKITSGLYKNLGLSMAIPYIFSERVKEGDMLVGNFDGIGDITLELKYAFAELAGINFAIKPSFILPTGKHRAGTSERHWQYGATQIATKEFNEGKYALHANLGFGYHDYHSAETRESTRSNFWSGSIAGEAKVLKGVTAVLDFGVATNPDKRSNGLPVYALVGARYEINELLDISGGVKRGLTRPENDIEVLYGLTLKL
jgi:hypothetical protein